MKVAFRVDASSQIGTGHFMRCLTLADALRRQNARIRFVCRHLPDYLKAMLAEKGHEYSPLEGPSCDTSQGNPTYAHWLGTSQSTDANDALLALSDHAWDWLVVDHYALDASWESPLRKAAGRLLVIDDLANRRHDCDLLLDQNFYSDMDGRYSGLVPAHCRLLLGPRYALLRDEFRLSREQLTRRNGPVRRVMVFFGGMDADNHTGRIVTALANHRIDGLHVDVVIGAQHPRREQIEAACNDQHFDCHVQTGRMAELMARADLAIGAGGAATWERCCVGLPAIAVCTAGNQARQVADAASAGMLYAPEIRGDLTVAIGKHFSALMENEGLRHLISLNAMKAVDGRGTLRTLEYMDSGKTEVRTAVQGDAKNLFDWRNQPAVRAVSRNSELIDWETHLKWFSSVLNNPDTLLLIGQRGGSPVGVVRFDVAGDAAEVSIYLVPGTHVPGQGRELLNSAERWFAEKRHDVRELRATVLGDNVRSQRLFVGAGYQPESATYTKRLD